MKNKLFRSFKRNIDEGFCCFLFIFYVLLTLNPRFQVQFESLPDLSKVWRPHSSAPRQSGCAPQFPQSFDELEETIRSPGEAATAALWYGAPHQNFPRNQLQYVRQIGTGRFGHILEGRAVGLFSDHTSSLDTTASATPSPRSATSSTPRGDAVPVTVVVKILKEDASQQEQTAFLQELKPYRLLQHRNLLRVLAVCLEASPLLVLLQHCPKGTLKRWLQLEGPTLSQRQLLTAITDVAAGLAHMHAHGMLHT